MNLAGWSVRFRDRVRGAHRRYIPVDDRLPACVEHSVKEEQEHGSHVATGGPVLVVVRGLAGVQLLEGVPTAIDDHGEGEEANQGGARAGGAAEVLQVEKGADDDGGEDLGKPVEEVIEGLGAGVEVGAIDGVLLVGVEPVGRPEHGEEQNNEGLAADGGPEADELGAPAGVLHQDDLGSIGAHDLLGIDQEDGQHGAAEHEHDQADVGAIGGCGIIGDAHVLAQEDLWLGVSPRCAG
jgi:hypothetical protein